MRITSSIFLFLVLIFQMVIPETGESARLKDVLNVNGVRNNHLIGFGVVVGLAGTGDSKLKITSQSTRMMLQRLGVSSTGDDRMKNIASVMVTASFPPFARQGTTIDATIASLGDAKSLKDGILIMTPLKGPDGKVYAVAQGPISVGGGISAGGNNATVSKGHNTVAKIVDGAVVEREIDFELGREKQLTLTLKNQDFTTSVRVAKNINDLFGEPIAKSHDSATVKVRVPHSYLNRISDFIARFEKIQVDTDTAARIVFNERTGTIIVGENVRVSTVALTHGSLSISVKEEGQNYVRDGGGDVIRDEQTGDLLKESDNTEIDIEESDASLMVMEESITLQDLVNGMNSLGVGPSDMIAILQALKASGAIQAELHIM